MTDGNRDRLLSVIDSNIESLKTRVSSLRNEIIFTRFILTIVLITVLYTCGQIGVCINRVKQTQSQIEGLKNGN